MMSGSAVKRSRVGYWWSEKKGRKFKLHESLQANKNKDLEFIKIDLEKPLEDQGPFDVIVHKLLDSVIKAHQGSDNNCNFAEEFKVYTENHPEIIVLDPVPNVAKFVNRYHEYKLVSKELEKKGGAFIPAFVELTTKNVIENAAKMKAAGVTFPCVCKPTQSHGSSLAHQMSVIFNEEGLKDVNPPCVAQKFINHNAILYKLCVVGDKYFALERPSLKNFTAGDQKTIFFDSHRVSKADCVSTLTELDEDELTTPSILPDKERVDHVVQVLCESAQLSLVGFDLIIDNKTGDYAIIDINIFPGYDGVDNFFQLLCDLILNRISQRANGMLCNMYRPTLADESLPLFQGKTVVQEKNVLNSLLVTHDEKCTALLPYTNKCFCCPISGGCSYDVLAEAKVLSVKSPLNLRAEFPSDMLNMHEIDGKGKAPFEQSNGYSPDSTQDDSGIETSDSCDEKKKATVVRNMKRQHSRNYAVAVRPDEAV